MTDVFFNIYIYICIYESRSKSFVYDLCIRETLRKIYRIKTCKTWRSRKQRGSLRKRMRKLTCVLGMNEWLDMFVSCFETFEWKNNKIMCLPDVTFKKICLAEMTECNMLLMLVQDLYIIIHAYILLIHFCQWIRSETSIKVACQKNKSLCNYITSRKHRGSSA